MVQPVCICILLTSVYSHDAATARFPWDYYSVHLAWITIQAGYPTQLDMQSVIQSPRMTQQILQGVCRLSPSVCSDWQGSSLMQSCSSGEWHQFPSVSLTWWEICSQMPYLFRSCNILIMTVEACNQFYCVTWELFGTTWDMLCFCLVKCLSMLFALFSFWQKGC